jgi:iron complex transport system permease protein
MLSERKKIFIIWILFILSVFALALCPLIGMSNISIKTLLEHRIDNLDFSIYWNIRLPRILLAFMVGAVLSICGMVFQAIFRNPLTTPFTLGVSSGAALGAIAFIIFGSEVAFFGVAKSYLAAFAGALLSIILVYAFARLRKGGFSTSTMLLAGVAINFFFSSLILLFQYLADFTKVFQTYRWLLGNLETFGFSKVINIAPFFVLGTFIIMLFNNELNLMLLGEDIAIGKGVDASRFKLIMFIICSLMVGVSVSLCGVIGFVGMTSPHICRIIIGSDHKYLTRASLLFGGFFLVVCDTIARKIIAPSELPIGIITALIGGPFFLWLLVARDAKNRLLG